MALVFSSEDRVGKQIDFVPKEATSERTLAQVYEVDRCLAWIRENHFSRVALQFPDEHLKDAVPVLRCLQNALPSPVTSFILGDTSYGSCCVDEVTAEHYNADSIIHFGSACLSPTMRLPVLYCFCPQQFNVHCVVRQVQELISDRSTPLIVMADTMYQHAVDSVASELQSTFSLVVASRLQIPPSVIKTSVDLLPHSEWDNTGAEGLPNRHSPVKDSAGPLSSNSELLSGCVSSYCKCHRCFSLPNDRGLDEFTIVYMGEEGQVLTNLMMTLNKCPFVTYKTESRTTRRETLNVSRELMKRYYMIERAKDANIVGIVAGTLGVSKTKEMIMHLKKLVKEAGKKSYTLAVGKLNVAKLANFMEVDVFVLVACMQNSLIDSKDFVKPVVTPFEMEVACNQARHWTGDYVTDFLQLLPGAAEYVPAVPASQDSADVSLVTNKLRILGRKSEVEASSVVMLRSDALTVSTLGEGSKDAAEYLASRSWKGLESGEGETTSATKLKQGRIGLPTQYEDEPTDAGL